MRHPKKYPKPVEDRRPPRPAPTSEGFIEMVRGTRKVDFLRVLWRNARDMGLLNADVRRAIEIRAKELGA